MVIEKELLDRLFANYNYKKPEDLIGENGLLKQLTKALLERALQTERPSTSVTKNMVKLPSKVAMPEMVNPPRPSRASLASCRLRFRVTATVASTRQSFPKGKPASSVLMIKSFPCMPEG